VEKSGTGIFARRKIETERSNIALSLATMPEAQSRLTLDVYRFQQHSACQVNWKHAVA
jgi:hypothetical protein